MTRLERERLRACVLFGCADIDRCAVKWGTSCVRQGGKKIPRLKGRQYHEVALEAGAGENVGFERRRARNTGRA